MHKRIVVGITGASGIIHAVKLLELLKGEAEVHLVVSDAAFRVLGLETAYTREDVEKLAHCVYDNENLAAPFSSGSFPVDGMVVVPCSIKTLSAIANCYSNTLISRAADVMLKERRRLVLCVRETPFHLGHLRLMTAAAESGAVICPPVPAFYSNPASVDDLVTQSAYKLLDLLSISLSGYRRWNGDCGFVEINSGVTQSRLPE
ncbi:MAG: UbiX family flavin prenyltransferase [Chitinispirillaceae bacterium]